MQSQAELQARFESAVRQYWTRRDSQSATQSSSGAGDESGRGEVTGGQHLDPVVELFADLFQQAGFAKESIKTGSSLQLPGYYRPEKKWDLIVIEEGIVVAAIEFKSQAGPSFGNNFNNRIEEAVGSATDLWVAYREGRLGPERPWLGYFMLLEEAERSTRAITRRGEPFFPIDPSFRDASYKRQYEIALERFLFERLYDAACFVTAPRDPSSGQLDEPLASLSFARFVKLVRGRANAIRLMAE